jgi:hypothetical protein
MFLESWLGWLRPECRLPAKRRGAAVRLRLEPLEDRLTPSGGYLYVGDYDGSSVLRYNEATGAFVDEFIPHKTDGLNQPQGLVFGPRDHNLYVTSGELYGQGNLKAVLRFDGATGGLLNNFTGSAHLIGPHAVIFGPDGNLYVADGFGTDSHVARFNGTTGAFIDEFVPPNTPGQLGPFGLVFGPGHRRDGALDLYVTSFASHSVRRYDGTTGAPLGEFVPSGSGGLQLAVGLTFGPDGNLYVASIGSFGGGVDTIMRFNGRTGAPMPSSGNDGAVFVAAGSGGLFSPFGGHIFGPDGNGDGRQDLYVPSFEFDGNNKAKAKTASIKRYDGVTGAFIDTFVTANSGGLDQPNYLTFTETDPMTLAYPGATTRASAAPLSAASVTAGAAAAQVNGGGRAVLTDPAGNTLTFGVAGVLHANGSVGGAVNFVFGPAFAQAWGAVPGVDALHLSGTVTARTVAEDGTVTLQGQLTEKDVARGGGVVFVEENIPFKIVVKPGSKQFTLQWCELPTFGLEMTDGNLTIR